MECVNVAHFFFFLIITFPLQDNFWMIHFLLECKLCLEVMHVHLFLIEHFEDLSATVYYSLLQQ